MTKQDTDTRVSTTYGHPVTYKTMSYGKYAQTATNKVVNYIRDPNDLIISQKLPAIASA